MEARGGVINCRQNENWSPKLKIEETNKNVNGILTKQKSALFAKNAKKTS
jgi:hypothetical protein